MAKRENYSRLKAKGRTERLAIQTILSVEEIKKYRSPMMQAKILRDVQDMGQKRFVESWLLRKLLIKLMEDPKWVLEFVEYDND